VERLKDITVSTAQGPAQLRVARYAVGPSELPGSGLLLYAHFVENAWHNTPSDGLADCLSYKLYIAVATGPQGPTEQISPVTQVLLADILSKIASSLKKKRNSLILISSVERCE
jgi:hypothetical protein